MLKVAIVGCGKIADSHAEQIRRIKNCEMVAVCDTEELMAQQLHERYPIRQWYSDLDKMLMHARPDVVHITTPPQSHLDIGLKCLEHGANIFVEKPFTIDTKDAEILLDAAQKAGKKVTVGHDAQFSIVHMRLRKLVNDGYIGDNPIHLESSWCYDLSDPTYAKALLSDDRHWARQLPGGLLHNIINHGIAKIAEFLTDDNPTIIAHGFSSSVLKSLGENKLVDELRVIIHEERGTTAYFTFSSQMKPSLNRFFIYGSQNGLMIDEDQRILTKIDGGSYKSFANHFIPPVVHAWQYGLNSIRNVWKFLKMDFHMDAGKKHLFESFYQSITQNTAVPIPYREILLTSRIMDSIFDQMAKSQNN